METIDWSLADGTKVRRFDFATGGGKKSVLEIVWKCRIPRVSFVTTILHFNLGRRFEKTKLEWWRALSHLLLEPLVISSDRLITVLATLDRRIQKEISMQLISIPRQTIYMHISQKFRNVSQQKKKPTFTTVDYLIYILNYAIFATWRIKKPARFLHERARRH